jgi:hypothetical protein
MSEYSIISVRSTLTALGFVILLLITPALAQSPAWPDLPGNAIILLRHATAPGVGDPPGFRLDDCATQRNLDDTGRAEARAIGERFRRRELANRF